jgi:predicted nucleic acid-binding protein
VLPALFGEVLIPPAVMTELTNERTPQEVRAWLSNRPEWLRVQAPRETLPQFGGQIDDGEREAIALAVEVKAGALIIDDRAGRRQAEALKCHAVGTLGVLADAAERGLVDLAAALKRLRATNFRADSRLSRKFSAEPRARSRAPVDSEQPSADKVRMAATGNRAAPADILYFVARVVVTSTDAGVELRVRTTDDHPHDDPVAPAATLWPPPPGSCPTYRGPDSPRISGSRVRRRGGGSAPRRRSWSVWRGPT